MLTQNENRACRLCARPVKGRSDKKFCDDFCRAAYHNELKSPSINLVRNVNNALCKNRRILESFLAAGEPNVKVNQEKMIQKGFQFRYHTHIYTTKNGNTYFYCYDYGYLQLENNRYLVVKRNDF